MEKLQTAATVLIVPGLRDHVPEHWQTLLQARLGKVRSVPPLETDKLSCSARVEAIERELASIDGPVILVAHSAGVLMVAHWAARYQRPIKAPCWPPHRTWIPIGRPIIPPPTACAPTAGHPCQAAGCHSPAWSRPAATTTWRASKPSPAWPTSGAASWSISARWPPQPSLGLRPMATRRGLDPATRSLNRPGHAHSGSGRRPIVAGTLHIPSRDTA